MEKQPRCCELHPGLWSGRTGVSRLCSAASPETGLGREQALLLLFTRSVVSNSFLTPWTVAHQAPLPWDSPGKNTGVGCHFLLQGIFLMQGLNLCPALAGGFFTTEPPGKPRTNVDIFKNKHHDQFSLPLPPPQTNKPTKILTEDPKSYRKT